MSTSRSFLSPSSSRSSSVPSSVPSSSTSASVSSSASSSSQRLSNATYRRNTKRHYIQQKQQKRKWRSLFNPLKLHRKFNSSANGSGVASSYYSMNSPSSSSASSYWPFSYFRLSFNSYPFRNYRNNYYNNLSSSYSSPYSSPYSPTLIGNKKKQCILSALLFSCFFLWSCVMFSFVKSSNHTSASNTTLDTATINNHHPPQQEQMIRSSASSITQQEMQQGHGSKTGAWANCTPLSTNAQTKQQQQQQQQQQTQHPDQRTTIVSCHTIQYRMKKSSLLKMKTNNNPIVIGVLSSAAGGTASATMTEKKTKEEEDDESFPSPSGFSRRQSIRETWAYNQTGVFFLVAQPFNYRETEYKKSSSSSSYSSSLEEEYETYGDLIWIDEEEVYDGEKSVLTYKTLSFVNIVHDLVMEEQQQQSNANEVSSFVKYLFKTDDDSYVHIQNLHHHLLSTQQQAVNNNDHKNRDYWGQCKEEETQPVRSESNKWSASMELYPEQLYPKYCQGAGFVLSWKVMHCASSSLSSTSGVGSTDSHIARARFMPFEDVAVGLIVKRCNLEPTLIEDEEWINMYRFGRQEEKWRVNKGLNRMPKWKLPKPNMNDGRFVQHRIYDDWDMKEHHKVVTLDEEQYSLQSKVNWYYRPK